MALVVAKFGGSSVASPERIRLVARKLIAIKNAGNDVVAVVSAMGKTTDELISLSQTLTKNPPAREMDRLMSTGEQVSSALMAMELEERGYRSMSFTGEQVGLHTDSLHLSAKITDITPKRLLEAVRLGFIPVVAGFQGIDDKGDVTTLGRGGSDATAVAIAYGVHADECAIYSDVDGIYTADPRVAPRAHKLDAINYDDMLELSSSGAGVLQARAVEFARRYHVVIHARSTFSDDPGTLIEGADAIMMEQAEVTGIAHDVSEVKVTLRGVSDKTGVAAKLFSALAGNNVNVDMIIQNISNDGRADITFTCPKADLPAAREVVENMLQTISARDYVVDESIAKVSLVGTGMKSSPGVAAKAFKALAENNVNIQMISTSPIRLSVVVSGDQMALAVRCLHTTFGLDSDSVFEEKMLSADEIAAKQKKGR